MMTENNAETHGYRWSDGTTRHHPEPKLNKALNDIAKLPATEKPPVARMPTPEQFAVAYADWVKEYSAWKAKYGSDK